MLGIVGGFLLTFVAVSVYAALTRHPRHPSQYGEDVVSLLGLWTGFVGAAVLATRWPAPTGEPLPAAAVATRPGRRGTGSVVRDYGLALRPWPDVPLGIAVGVASQYLLVPVVEAPLCRSCTISTTRLSHPAQSLTGHAFGPGSRRARRPRLRRQPRSSRSSSSAACCSGRSPAPSRSSAAALGPVLSIVVTALVFALAHFEALQFLGLAGFGVVLGPARLADGPARTFDRRPHGVQHRHDHRHRGQRDESE